MADSYRGPVKRSRGRSVWGRPLRWLRERVVGARGRPAFDFDALAQDLARGLSRREALVRLGGGLAGALLASLGLPRAWGQANSDCAHWCHAHFSGSDAGHCTSEAAHGTGPCSLCGPAAPPGHPDFCNGSATGPTCCTALAPTCCNGVCTDLTQDNNNCGQCMNACGAGTKCVGGQCTTICPAGQTLCSGRCVDTTSDASNCGGCGNVCPTPANGRPTCASGACGISCNTGFTNCGGVCVDTSSDVNNCGACGTVCPAPANGAHACASGKCEATQQFQVGANCGGVVQLCDQIVNIPISTQGELKVEFILDPHACSSIKVHILVDGVERYTSGPLAPGQSTGVVDLGPVPASSHTIGLQAEGVVGGCNTGILYNYGGTLNVTYQP